MSLGRASTSSFLRTNRYYQHHRFSAAAAFVARLRVKNDPGASSCSSTLCALNYSNKVIDEKTILIFDEFIINDKWEQDEFKALNEFCNNLGFSYEVLAISFTTKQVAVKLKKN